MTKAYLERDGRRYTVDVRSHATGSAECCAAVSMLVYTLAGWYANTQHVKPVSLELDEGVFHMVWEGRKAASEVFELAVIGFFQLSEQYREYISAELQEIS